VVSISDLLAIKELNSAFNFFIIAVSYKLLRELLFGACYGVLCKCRKINEHSQNDLFIVLAQNILKLIALSFFSIKFAT
jgi:hypothetical protein